MSKDKADAQLLKGLLDMLVLSVLEKGDNYGFGILQAVEEQLEDDRTVLQDATIYPLLHRLESKNHVESYFKPGDRGTPRKYYRITSQGKSLLKNRISEWRKVTLVLQKIVLSGKEF